MKRVGRFKTAEVGAKSGGLIENFNWHFEHFLCFEK
jgi:hypothetical protein